MQGILQVRAQELTREDTVLALLQMAGGQFQLGQLDAADVLVDQGMALAVQSSLHPRISAFHHLQSELHATRQQWEAAYRALQAHHQLEGRLREETMERRLRLEAHRLHIQLLEDRASGERAQREQLQEQQDRIVDLAYRDALTGLMNRPAFRQAAEAVTASPEAGTVGLLFIDLNDFKPLNDTYGHAFGDLVLRAVAQRLLDVVRAEDLVARLGGDEFVILARRAWQEDVERLSDEVRERLARPLVLEERPVALSAAVGWAVGAGPLNLSELMRQADDAMYRRKRQRSGRSV